MTNQPIEGCRGDIKRGDYYHLEEFIALDSLLGDPKGNGLRNYAHAGALLNFMINTKKKPVAGKFGKFLAAARKQGHGFARGPGPSARLIKSVYDLSVAEFEDVWLDHLRIRH